MFQYTTKFWVFIFQKMANFEALHWNNLSNIYLLLQKRVLLARIQGHQSVLKSSSSERGGARNFGVYETTASKETYLVYVLWNSNFRGRLRPQESALADLVSLAPLHILHKVQNFWGTLVCSEFQIKNQNKQTS